MFSKVLLNDLQRFIQSASAVLIQFPELFCLTGGFLHRFFIST